MTTDEAVIGWLLDSDPSIRWQVLRDLLDAPEPLWRAERALVANSGWGARLLDLEDADGQWAGGAFLPSDFGAAEWEQVGQPWTATAFVLDQLREFGLDPGSEPARSAVRLVGANSHWEEGGQPFWEGEVEECINGRTVADGAYFGVDVAAIVDRLVGELLPDGGWNCERANGSVRSSFHSTINVLEGLLEFERSTGGTAASRAARASGEEYLAARGLFRRLSTGEPADERFLRVPAPKPLAVRPPPGPRPLPIGSRTHRCRPRSTARRGRRTPPLPATARRHLAARLAAAGPGLVRRRRPAGQSLPLGHPAGLAGAAVVGRPGETRFEPLSRPTGVIPSDGSSDSPAAPCGLDGEDFA